MKRIVTIDHQNHNEKMIINKQCIKIKLFFFVTLNYLFLFIFWFYISCFGVVYKNTQIHVIKDTLSSFLFSLLYPFVTCLIPGIFRIPSLIIDKQNRECLYKLSQFIEVLS